VPETKADFRGILRVLAEKQVKFIVVGGVSAVLQGAPFTTFDLDVVHSRDPENVERLLEALESASHLSSRGHQLLVTRVRPLDLLGMIGAGHEYAELLAHTVEMDIGAGVTVPVLDLETVIRTKEETAGQKDKAILFLLRRTLEEKKK